jgi:hypothetical protein
MATCRSCGASIIWTLTPAGKRFPVDAEPDRESGTIFVRAGYMRRLDGDELEEARARDAPLYVAHWATCPQSRSWRRT